MPDLTFAVTDAAAVSYAAAPTLEFTLNIENRDAEEQIQSVALRCQIQIETTRRRYSEAERKQLFELFGEPERWSQTLRAMLWTHAQINVPPFENNTTVNLPVECTFDFNIAATKYFAGLESGEVPLLLLFSGTVFYDAGDGLQIAQISWEREAQYRLPVSVWHAMMEHYYPNTNWLSLRRDTFERLREYKTKHYFTSWEQALEKLLAQAEVEEEIKKSAAL